MKTKEQEKEEKMSQRITSEHLASNSQRKYEAE
jgi:hypothetical protein